MKRPFQVIRIGIVAGALAMVPAYAQTASDPASGQPASGSAASSGQTVPGTDMNSPSRTNYNNDHNFNFGWVGLVGLVGLLGLRRHNARVDRHDEARNIDNTGPRGVR